MTASAERGGQSTATTARREVGREVDRAAASPVTDGLGRAGILARAIVVFVIAGITVDIVRGSGSRQADSRGALETIAGTSVGLVLLVLLAAAFAGHAGWRILEAAAGLRQDDAAKRTAKRIGYAIVGLIYAGLAITTVRILAGRHTDSEDATSRRTTSDLLGLPGGRAVTALAGAVIVGVAIGIAVWALRGGFQRSLHVERLSTSARSAVRWLGAAGQGARAWVLAMAGFLFIDAAVENDPSRAQGLDGTLRTIAARPFGSALLLTTAAGLAVFGCMSIVEAWLRRSTSDQTRRA